MKKGLKIIITSIMLILFVIPFTVETISTEQTNNNISTFNSNNMSAGVIKAIAYDVSEIKTNISIEKIEKPIVTQGALLETKPSDSETEINEEVTIPKDTYIKKEYVEYAKEIVKKYPNLKLSLVIAVIECESSGRPSVVSKAGAVGLMQIIPKWVKDRMSNLGVTDLYDPYSNILVGCDILSEHLNTYDGNVYAALMRYNGTKNPGDKAAAGNYSEYSKKVVNRANELTLIYD